MNIEEAIEFDGRNTEFYKSLDSFNATMIAEGADKTSEENLISSWQYLIDNGICWSLQGFFGRTAMNLIEQGICQKAI